MSGIVGVDIYLAKCTWCISVQPFDFRLFAETVGTGGRLRVCVLRQLSLPRARARVCVFISVCVFINVCVCVLINVCVCVCVCVCVYL